MNKVISEILFNRGLMWVVLANVRAMRGDTIGKLLPLVFFAFAVYNFYRSWKMFGTEE